MRLTWIFSSGSTSPESHYQEQSHLNLVIRISLTWILFPSSGSASPESYSHHPDQPHLNLIHIIRISLTWILFPSSGSASPESRAFSPPAVAKFPRPSPLCRGASVACRSVRRWGGQGWWPRPPQLSSARYQPAGPPAGPAGWRRPRELETMLNFTLYNKKIPSQQGQWVGAARRN